MSIRVHPWWLLCFALTATLGGCGKKGPPLAPLNLVPEPAANVSARRIGDTVFLQMAVPRKNANGPGPPAIDHLEVYAVTAAAGAPAPANRILLSSSHVIGRIPVKPPPSDDEPAPADDAPKDPRPGPGDPVTFTEKLTAAQLTPEILPAPARSGAASAPAEGGGTTTPHSSPDTASPAQPPANPTSASAAPADVAVPAAGGSSIGGAPATLPPAAAASPAPAQGAVGGTPAPAAGTPPASTAASAAPSVPTRVYIVRAITNKGRPGTPSARVTVPLVTPPSPPTALATTYTEQAVTVSWLPPVAEGPATPHMSFNVYAMPTKAGAATMASIPAADAAEAAGAAPAPLNEKPLDSASFEHSRVNWGVEQCFVARTVQIIAGTMVEGEPSAPACVTPRDTFPPAAPKGLSAVAGPGAINLIWDANTEADLAGYVVLRGEAPGDTLQPLTAQPTRETRFRDTAVTSGVRYVYAVVAVDRAGNRSAQSARFEETAR